MNQKVENNKINILCDMIEEYQALLSVFHGYVNGPIDLDKENCFV